ncbi:MAG: hypothetical protein OXG19_11005 [Chloroflexi bacterium]|nr:hypothetical protein [Chloroflexota bacterium]
MPEPGSYTLRTADGSGIRTYEYARRHAATLQLHVRDAGGRDQGALLDGLRVGDRPDLDGRSLSFPIRHGPFHLVPEHWRGALEPTELADQTIRNLIELADERRGLFFVRRVGRRRAPSRHARYRSS